MHEIYKKCALWIIHMKSRPKYESKPMSRPSSKCESIDSLEANTGRRDCEYNDIRKRVKNMHEIYKKCDLWIIHMDME